MGQERKTLSAKKHSSDFDPQFFLKIGTARLSSRGSRLKFFHMPTAIRELEGLRATIDRVVFTPQLDAPHDRPYPFVYYITIHNDSLEAVQIKGRKWVVTDAGDQRIVVEGDGVVGKFPHIGPGENFSYNSCHVIATDSIAEGAFFGTTDAGEPVFTRIPPFEMRVP